MWHILYHWFISNTSYPWNGHSPFQREIERIWTHCCGAWRRSTIVIQNSRFTSVVIHNSRDIMYMIYLNGKTLTATSWKSWESLAKIQNTNQNMQVWQRKKDQLLAWVGSKEQSWVVMKRLVAQGQVQRNN